MAIALQNHLVILILIPVLLQELKYAVSYLDSDWQTLCGSQWGEIQEAATIEGSILYYYSEVSCVSPH